MPTEKSIRDCKKNSGCQCKCVDEVLAEAVLLATELRRANQENTRLRTMMTKMAGEIANS